MEEPLVWWYHFSLLFLEKEPPNELTDEDLPMRVLIDISMCLTTKSLLSFF
jgi:hypothetical protein